jgi:hypothetical protein
VIAALSAGGLLVSACATVTSTEETPASGGAASSTGEGLPYYLPRRPILISVAVGAAAPNLVTLTVAPGVMEPDMAHRFTLKYGQNPVGTNAIVVAVSTKGLLQSANNTITSSTGQIGTSLGALAGAVAGMAAGVGAPPVAAQPCAAGQTYNYVFHTDSGLGVQPAIACGIVLTITRDPPGAAAPPANASLLPGAGKSKAGFFFRQELAYKIEGQDSAGKLIGQWVAYSPDASDTFFYPVSATLFANSHTNFVFTDGIPTSVDQTTDSEINGALQIPANIITGYTTALGQVFSAFNTDRTDKVAAAVSKSKLDYCKATIAANPLTGKSPADQATAEANIKAACQ